MARRLVALALLALALLGCRETAVVLSIHAKAKIPGDLDAIGLQVVADGGLRLSRRYPLQSAPQSLSVVAGDDPDGGFEVRLTGQRLLLTTSYQRKQLTFSSGIVTEDLTVPSCETTPPLPPGSGTFEARSLAPEPTQVAAVGAASVPMWVVAPALGKRMGWTQGDGGLNMYAHPGGFPERPNNEPLPPINRVVAVDIDNDASLDLLLLTTAGPRLWRHEDDDSFKETFGPLPTTAVFNSAAAGDLNGDGYADLVLAGADRVTMLFSDKKPGTFSDATSLLSLPLPESGAAGVAIGLLARDASADLSQPALVFARGKNPDVMALRSSGGGFSGGEITPAVPKLGASTSVAVADVNRDGYADVAFGRTGGASVIYLNNRAESPRVGATPDAVITLDGSEEVQDLIAADLHNDCRQDIVLGTRSGVRIWENGGLVAGRVSFSEVQQPASLPSLTQLIAADFSGDGLLDLAGPSSVNTAWLLQQPPPR